MSGRKRAAITRGRQMREKGEPMVTLIMVWRAVLGISQVEASKRLGLSDRLIAKWEQGRQVPRGKNYDKIFNLFDQSY